MAISERPQSAQDGQRLDYQAKLTGRAAYLADMKMAGVCEGSRPAQPGGPRVDTLRGRVRSAQGARGGGGLHQGRRGAGHRHRALLRTGVQGPDHRGGGQGPARGRSGGRGGGGDPRGRGGGGQPHRGGVRGPAAGDGRARFGERGCHAGARDRAHTRARLRRPRRAQAHREHQRLHPLQAAEGRYRAGLSPSAPMSSRTPSSSPPPSTWRWSPTAASRTFQPDGRVHRVVHHPEPLRGAHSARQHLQDAGVEDPHHGAVSRWRLRQQGLSQDRAADRGAGAEGQAPGAHPAEPGRGVLHGDQARRVHPHEDRSHGRRQLPRDGRPRSSWTPALSRRSARGWPRSPPTPRPGPTSSSTSRSTPSRSTPTSRRRARSAASACPSRPGPASRRPTSSPRRSAGTPTSCACRTSTTRATSSSPARSSGASASRGAWRRWPRK